jgi:hypothetical protein
MPLVTQRPLLTALSSPYLRLWQCLPAIARLAVAVSAVRGQVLDTSGAAVSGAMVQMVQSSSGSIRLDVLHPRTASLAKSTPMSPAFRNSSASTLWVGLCPEKPINGG